MICPNHEVTLAVLTAIYDNCPSKASAVLGTIYDNPHSDRTISESEFAEATYVTAEKTYNIADVRENFTPLGAYDQMVKIETENSFK